MLFAVLPLVFIPSGRGKREFILGSNPPLGRRCRIRRLSFQSCVRHLSQGEIFGEPARGETFGCAFKERAKGAAGRVGPYRTPQKVSRDARAVECFLEMTPICF